MVHKRRKELRRIWKDLEKYAFDYNDAMSKKEKKHVRDALDRIMWARTEIGG